MVGPHKGDVPFEAGGKTYTLRYGHAALFKLEKTLDKGLAKVIDDMGDPERMRVGTVIALLWVGLQKHHPSLSFDDAADLMDEIEGGSSGAMKFVDEGFRRAFNAPPGTKGTNPPQSAGNGTGMASGSSTSVMDTIPTVSGTSPRAS